MEDKTSENEELRKQIKFLTNVIENARSEQQNSHQKHLQSYHSIPARYSQHGNVSRSRKHSFLRGASQPECADWNIHHRERAYKFRGDTLHYRAPSHSDLGSRQSKLPYTSKYRPTKPELSSIVTVNDNPAVVKSSPESSTALSCLDQPIKSNDAIDRKSTATHEKTKLKQALSSKRPHHSSVASVSSVTKSSDLAINTRTDAEKPENLEKKNQSQIKSAPVKSNTDQGQIKSSVNSGNRNKIQMESNSILLKKEIEKMHNEIAELKKTLSAKQVNSDLVHQETAVQISSKSSGLLEKSVSKKCSSPSKKIVQENDRSSLHSLVKSVTVKADSSVTKCGSPVKQQKYMADNSVAKSGSPVKQQHTVDNSVTKSCSPVKQQKYTVDNSVTKSGSPAKHVHNSDTDILTGKLNAEQNRTAKLDKPVPAVDVSKATTNVNNMNTDLKQPQSDLISLSKYKLTRVASSPTKHSPVKAWESFKSTSEAINKDGKLSWNTEPISSSAKAQSASLAPVAKPGLRTNTPAKFIKKSKYSITRVKNSGKKGSSSKKRLVKSHTNTPAKFVSFSKYALKRVRRSLSDENKQGLQKNTSFYKVNERFMKGHPYSESVKSSVRVVRSKFKMEKVQSHLHTKNYFVQSQGTQSYKFQRRNPYRQRSYQSFGQRFQERQYWRTRYSFDSYSKRGRYSGRYKGQEWTYRGGRYRRPFKHQTYNRRLSVSQRYVQRRLQRLKEDIPFNPKHKLDRRMGSHDIKRPVNFLMINGMLYKSSTKTLMKAVSQKPSVSQTLAGAQQPKVKKLDTTNMKTVTVRGVKFKVDSQGRSLKRVHQPDATKSKTGKAESASSSRASQISRVDIGGVTYMQTKPGTLERVGSVKSRMAATRVVNKTVQRAAAKYKKDNTKVLKKKKYCMFYNRFGKCNKKGSCTYIHDPDKVAVCTRFLRGTCKVKDCPFSHKVSKDKMPVCSYFLKGVCNRDSCPYLHVNVNRDAEVCQDFVNGYCPQGETCKKKHILKCPEFTKMGKCSKGKKCNLQHRTGKRKSQLPGQSALGNSKKLKLSEQPASSASDVVPAEIRIATSHSLSEDDRQIDCQETNTDLPFKERKLPAYISLKTNRSKVNEDDAILLEDTQKLTDKPAMKIRPQL